MLTRIVHLCKFSLESCENMRLLVISILAVAAQAFTLNMALSGKAMIIQNKGGGHGTIGYYLAKELKEKNPDLKIAILQDSAYKKSKEPFLSYSELVAMGIEIQEVALGEESPDMGSLKDFTPDFVIDNWSKSEANASFALNLAKSAQHLVFVSSAGMYNNDKTKPQLETNSVKTNAVREVEIVYNSAGVPFTHLRPQYIYGPKSNKKYLDYFLGRILRDLPVPIPGSGDQVVALTHIEDVASLVACTVGNDAAKNEVINCGTDKYTGYRQLCEWIGKEMNKDAKV
jgi:hypothetical protein